MNTNINKKTEVITYDEGLDIRARVDDLGRVLLPREVTKTLRLGYDQNVALRVGTLENGRKCLVVSPHLHLDDFTVAYRKTMVNLAETLRSTGSKLAVALFDQTGHILWPSSDYLYNHRENERLMKDAVNAALSQETDKPVIRVEGKVAAYAVPVFRDYEDCEQRPIGVLLALGNESELPVVQVALRFAVKAMTTDTQPAQTSQPRTGGRHGLSTDGIV